MASTHTVNRGVEFTARTAALVVGYVVLTLYAVVQYSPPVSPQLPSYIFGLSLLYLIAASFETDVTRFFLFLILLANIAFSSLLLFVRSPGHLPDYLAQDLFVAVFCFLLYRVAERILLETGQRRLRVELRRDELAERFNELSEEREKIRASLPRLARTESIYQQINELGIRFAACRTEEELVDLFFRHLKGFFPEETACGIRVERSSPPLIRATAGLAAGAWEDAFAAWVRDADVPLIVRDLETDYRFSGAARDSAGFHSLIIVPFHEEHVPAGCVRLESSRPNAFSMENLKFVYHLTYLMALAWQTIRLYARTVELSRRDGLTNLYKRWCFDEEMEKQVQRSRRHRNPLALVVIDIDNFRHFNNTYGHGLGDVVLRRVADVLSAAAPPLALPTRIGGEEMCLLLPECSRERAQSIAESIRRGVEERAQVTDIADRVTVSVGVAIFLPDLFDSPHAFFEAADRALYRAKAEGKNRVAVHE